MIGFHNPRDLTALPKQFSHHNVNMLWRRSHYVAADSHSSGWLITFPTPRSPEVSRTIKIIVLNDNAFANNETGFVATIFPLSHLSHDGIKLFNNRHLVPLLVDVDQGHTFMRCLPKFPAGAQKPACFIVPCVFADLAQHILLSK